MGEIHIPGMSQEMGSIAFVIAVGPAVRDPQIFPGVRVIFPKTNITKIEVDTDKEHAFGVIHEEDVRCIVLSWRDGEEDPTKMLSSATWQRLNGMKAMAEHLAEQIEYTEGVLNDLETT